MLSLTMSPPPWAKTCVTAGSDTQAGDALPEEVVVENIIEPGATGAVPRLSAADPFGGVSPT